MASRMILFRLIVVAGVILGAWSMLPSLVSAQSPTKTLNQAMRDGDVEEIGEPFAVSNKDTLGMNIRYRTLRNTAATASGPSIVNWPRRADGCATPYATNSQLKTLPTIPAFAGDRDKQPEDLHEYTSGNWRAWSGACRYYRLSQNWRTAELIFDAGTSVTPPWSGTPGFSISPTAYGGWAMPLATPTTLSNSIETRRSTWSARSASCGNDINYTIFSGWLDPEPGPPSGTDPYVTAPIRYNPMHPTASPIWSQPCKNNFDLWDGIYRDNGYTSTQINNAIDWYRYASSEWRIIENIMNSGVSLFRQTVTLTQADIDAIKIAETRNGGLGLDIVADDWYTAYLNGDYMSGSTYTIGDSRYTRLPSSLLKVGTNVLGVEVIDKINVNQNYSSSGVGVIFQVRLFDKPGYELAPTTVCYNNATGEAIPDNGAVPSGTSVRCEHRFPMSDLGGGDMQTLATRYRVTCTLTDATTSSNCAVPMTPATVYTRAQLNGIKNAIDPTKWDAAPFTVPLAPFTVNGPDKAKVCTFITLDPRSRIRLSGGTYGPPRDNPRTPENEREISSVQKCFFIGTGGPGPAGQPPISYFRGGDVFASGNISGSLSGTNGTRGDYAVISNGNVYGQFGSWRTPDNTTLMFASSPRGNFGVVDPLPYTIPASGTSSVGGPVNLSTIPKGKYQYTSSVEIAPASDLSEQIQIHVTGNITIKGNITVDTTTSFNAKELPNIVLVATGDIIIEDGVTQVDATLVSGGLLRTCSTPKNNLSTSICSDTLRINGPISARRIGLYRTKIDGFTPNETASEVITFRPSALIVPYLNATSGALTTDIEYELPPRY